MIYAGDGYGLSGGQTHDFTSSAPLHHAGRKHDNIAKSIAQSGWPYRHRRRRLF